MLGSSIGCVFAWLALIDKGNLDRLACLRLDSFRWLGHLSAVLFIRCRDAQGEQLSECIDCQVNFGAFPTFGAIISGTFTALSGVDRKMRPSKIAAGGFSLRPSPIRKMARRSWTSDSKAPALIQRRDC